MDKKYNHKSSVFTSVRNEIISILSTHLDSRLTYHSIQHTLSVEDAVIFYACAEGVSESEALDLRYAALFHDSGFLSSYSNNESAGVALMREVTERNEIDSASINQIERIILATQQHVEPKDLLEKIICDSDHDYLGTNSYLVRAANLYNEKCSYEEGMTELEWLEAQINYLKNRHKYHTVSAIKRRNAVKLDWIRHLESELIVRQNEK